MTKEGLKAIIQLYRKEKETKTPMSRMRSLRKVEMDAELYCLISEGTDGLSEEDNALLDEIRNRLDIVADDGMELDKIGDVFDWQHERNTGSIDE